MEKEELTVDYEAQLHCSGELIAWKPFENEDDAIDFAINNNYDRVVMYQYKGSECIPKTCETVWDRFNKGEILNSLSFLFINKIL